MNRLTYRYIDSQGEESITLDTRGEDYLYKLWRYEETGLEPEEIIQLQERIKND